MVWFNVDDNLAFHRKTIQAGNAAMGLWVRAGSWCTQTLTDGYVPTAMARSLGTPAQAKALVESGLWLTAEGGYRFHEWNQRQQTKSDVEAKREADRVRKAEQRKRRTVPPGQTGNVPPDIPPDDPEDFPPDSATDSARESLVPPRANPFPTTPFHSKNGYVGGGSHESIARGNEPPPRCSKHLEKPTEAPCVPCRAARIEHETWTANERRRAVEARSAETRRTAELRGQAVAECDLCDEDGYRGTTLCDHDPGTLARSARGIAEVRAALAKAAKAADHE